MLFCLPRITLRPGVSFISSWSRRIKWFANDRNLTDINTSTQTTWCPFVICIIFTTCSSHFFLSVLSVGQSPLHLQFYVLTTLLTEQDDCKNNQQLKTLHGYFRWNEFKSALSAHTLKDRKFHQMRRLSCFFVRTCWGKKTNICGEQQRFNWALSNTTGDSVSKIWGGLGFGRTRMFVELFLCRSIESGHFTCLTLEASDTSFNMMTGRNCIPA